MSLTVFVGRTSSNWLPAAVWPSAAKYERAHGGSAPLDPLEVTQNPLALGCARQVSK